EEVRLVDVFLCVLATSDDELKDEVVLLRYQEGRNDVRSAADQVVTDEINGLVRYSSDHDMLRFGAINVNDVLPDTTSRVAFITWQGLRSPPVWDTPTPFRGSLINPFQSDVVISRSNS